MNSMQWTANFEGRRNLAYWDDIGKCWTNGIGHTGPWLNDKGETIDTIEEGTTWTDTEIDLNYEFDHTRAVNAAMNALGVSRNTLDANMGKVSWDTLNEARRAVLTDLAFELGGEGLRKFTNFLAFVRNRMYVGASEDLKTTLLNKQVPHRVAANAWAMKVGVLELPPAHLS